MNGNRMYLDHAATTPICHEAAAAMTAYLNKDCANPSSAHAQGMAAAEALADARNRMASHLGCAPDELIFTSGGTESDNLAVKGYALAHREQGNHIIVSAAEHAAVLESAAFLESCGFSVTYLPSDRNGIILPEQLTAVFRPDTILVCIMHVNNETGVMQDISALAQIAHKHGAAFFSDGVAAVGHMPICLDALGIDLYSASAHKFGGPCGIGFLYRKKGTILTPLLHGGGQEDHLRGGTEPVMLCLGMAAALEQSVKNESVKPLRDRLESALLQIPDSICNGREAPRADYIGNISFIGCSGESIAALCDIRGLSLSTGAACHSGSLKPSHVLTAMGVGETAAKGTIRFSLSAATTSAEIDRAAEIITDIVTKIRTAL